MTQFDWVIASLTFMSVLAIPLLVLAFKGMIRWTHVEDKLSHLVDAVEQLVDDKDKTHGELRADEQRIHAEILEQMRTDRDATDRRLRFVEEAFMRGAMAYGSAGPVAGQPLPGH